MRSRPHCAAFLAVVLATMALTVPAGRAAAAATTTAVSPASTASASPAWPAASTAPASSAAAAPARSASAAHPVAAQATATLAPGPLQEIEVIGERPGPRLWKVTDGDHVLWILGTLGPLPKRMTWRSQEVETVLQSSQQVLAPQPALSLGVGPFAAIGLYLQWRRIQKNPDGADLRQELPAPLYARVEALRQKYDPHDDRLERMSPLFAARRLYERAIDASGLVPEFTVERTVFDLARRNHVPVERVGMKLPEPKALLTDLGDTPPAARIQCLETTVSRLETDIPTMQVRARAWALGDVDTLRRLPYPDQRDVCWSAISVSARIKAFRAQMRQTWIDAAEAALKRNRSTLTLRPMDDLLGSDGALAVLRAHGYHVDGP